MDVFIESLRDEKDELMVRGRKTKSFHSPLHFLAWSSVALSALLQA